MNEKLLQEYLERVGIVTGPELEKQTGAARGSWREPAVALLEKKEIYLSRLDHGRETMLSKHLWFCLKAVYHQPELEEDAQELYDWLSEHEVSDAGAMREQSGFGRKEFILAFSELQRRLCVAPLVAKGRRETPDHSDEQDLSGEYDFLWVTDEYWMHNVHRPSRYNDLAYCLSELRRLLKDHFSTREINGLLYKGKLL